MMGSSMPSAQSLSDLMTLLQLLQAASDPATSKKTLELFVAERKKYDDAIAQAAEMQRTSEQAQAAARASIEASEQAKAAAEEALSKADASAQELIEEEERIGAVRATLINAKAALEAESKAQSEREAAHRARVKEWQDAVAKQRVEIADEFIRAQQEHAKAQTLKDELQAKMDRLKALAE